MILSGELAPGQPIRQEEIAAALGVSRVPVRESLKILEGEGHVRHIPRQGFEVIHLRMGDLFDIYRMRELLEPEALSFGVPLLTDEALGVVRIAMTELEDDPGDDIMKTIAANTRFHLTPIEACNKLVLSRTLRILWETATPFAIRFMLSAERELIQAEHAKMLRALEARDTDRVIKEFATHRETSLERIRVFHSSAPHWLDPPSAPSTAPEPSLT